MSTILPNFIMIGAQKAGTTSMYNWLSQHHDIYAPFHLKDLPYFTTDLHQKGIEHYSKVFNTYKNQKVITACETNAIFFDFAAKRIHDFNPNMKVLLLVRNPVNRAFSAYNYALQRGLEDKSFKEAIHEEKNNLRDYNTHYQKAQKAYIDHGYYFKQLQPYIETFPKENLFIGLAEDMRNNKEQIMTNICNFLEIDTSAKIKYTNKNKTYSDYHFDFINKILNNEKTQQSSVLGSIFDMMPVAFSYKLKRKVYNILSALNQKQTEITPIDEEDQQFLREIYKGDVEQLSRLIDRDLVNLWL